MRLRLVSGANWMRWQNVAFLSGALASTSGQAAQRVRFLMRKIPPVIGRIFSETILFSVGAVFMAFGYTAAGAGSGVKFWGFGAVFFLPGLIACLLAPIWIWRGGRLGAGIRGDCLVVHHYFRDTVIPLESPLVVYRCVECTAIETPKRRYLLDDAYFADFPRRDALFEELSARARAGGHVAPRALGRGCSEWIGDPG